MATVMEVILRGRDELIPVLQNAQRAGESAGSALHDSFQTAAQGAEAAETAFNNAMGAAAGFGGEAEAMAGPLEDTGEAADAAGKGIEGAGEGAEKTKSFFDDLAISAKKLFGEIVGSTGQFGALKTAAADISREMHGTALAINEAETASQGLVLATAALTAGAAIALGTVAALGEAGADWANQMNVTANMTGLSTEAAEKWSNALAIAGIGTGQLSMVTLRLSMAMGQLAEAQKNHEDATDKGAKQLAKLGVEVTNADGSMRDMDETMQDVFAKTAALGSAQAQTAAFTDIFSFRGRQLLAVVREWGPVMENATRETLAHRMGIEDVQGFTIDYNTTMLDLRLTFEQMATNAAPSFLAALHAIDGGVKAAAEGVKAANGFLVQHEVATRTAAVSAGVLAGTTALGALVTLLPKIASALNAATQAAVRFSLTLLTTPIGIITLVATLGLLAIAYAKVKKAAEEAEEAQQRQASIIHRAAEVTPEQAHTDTEAQRGVVADLEATEAAQLRGVKTIDTSTRAWGENNRALTSTRVELKAAKSLLGELEDIERTSSSTAEKNAAATKLVADATEQAKNKMAEYSKKLEEAEAALRGLTGAAFAAAAAQQLIAQQDADVAGDELSAAIAARQQHYAEQYHKNMELAIEAARLAKQIQEEGDPGGLLAKQLEEINAKEKEAKKEKLTNEQEARLRLEEQFQAQLADVFLSGGMEEVAALERQQDQVLGAFDQAIAALKAAGMAIPSTIDQIFGESTAGSMLNALKARLALEQQMQENITRATLEGGADRLELAQKENEALTALFDKGLQTLHDASRAVPQDFLALINQMRDEAKKAKDEVGPEITGLLGVLIGRRLAAGLDPGGGLITTPAGGASAPAPARAAGGSPSIIVSHLEMKVMQNEAGQITPQQVVDVGVEGVRRAAVTDDYGLH